MKGCISSVNFFDEKIKKYCLMFKSQLKHFDKEFFIKRWGLEFQVNTNEIYLSSLSGAS